MNRKGVWLILAVVILSSLLFVWYRYRSINADVTTNTSTLISEKIPKAITFMGKVTVDGSAISSLSIVVGNRAFAVKSDGTFIALVPRSFFLDDGQKARLTLPVEFVDLVNNKRYQPKDIREKIMLHLPGEWFDSSLVTYMTAGSSSRSYVPSAAFFVKRDFDLTLVK